VEGSSGSPLANVIVEFTFSPLSQLEGDEPLLASTNTDTSGFFSFEPLANELEGTLRVLELPSGYVTPLMRRVHLSSLSPTAQVTFSVGPAAALTGSVVLASGTADFTKFVVEVNTTEADVTSDGRFTIHELPASQQTGRVIYQDGYYFDERVIQLPPMTPGQTNAMEIVWHQPMRDLSGRGALRDANGNVLAGARIRFLGMNTGVFVGMKTDVNGNYAVYDLPDDCYAVRAFVGRWGVEQRALSATDSILCVGNGGGSSNGDGIPDGWRLHYFGTLTTNSSSCASCDEDADGISNLQEYLRGTDPMNPASANITLYANSVTGNDSLDGITPIVMATHGPKRSIQSAISAAISGDSVQIAGDQAAYNESTWDPGTKTLILRPTGAVTILP
jgi:hypothetical protein